MIFRPAHPSLLLPISGHPTLEADGITAGKTPTLHGTQVPSAYRGAAAPHLRVGPRTPAPLAAPLWSPWPWGPFSHRPQSVGSTVGPLLSFWTPRVS